jgi:tetratricopeptide (TPR) repeat protein
LKTATVRISNCASDSANYILVACCAILPFPDKNNILDRLWRNCFYQRIADERKEISRRKRKNAGSVPQATAIFHKFLQEAIDLYRYLVKFYISLVSPADPLVEGSQSYDLSEEDLDEDGKGAVVAILHRFEIYLGDLHRYGDKYQDAACHYERAAMLAPGQGNPYNQLAVLEQLKDSSCNALYWYARSIRASIKPFETSLANVERLYQSNRKWLMDNPEGIVRTSRAKGDCRLNKGA